MKLSVIFILALVAAIIAFGGLFVFSVFGMRGGRNMDVIVASIAIAIPFLAMCICCSIAMERHHLPRWMRSGLYAAGIALVGWIIHFWRFDSFARETFPLDKYIIWPSVWAGAMALFGLLALPAPPRRSWRSVRNVTLVLVCLLAAHIALATTLYPKRPPAGLSMTEENNYYDRRYEFEEYGYRIGMTLGLITLAGLSTSFLLLLLLPKRPGQIDAPRPYWLTCPRCAKEQTLHTGWDRCPNCGLEISVGVHE